MQSSILSCRSIDSAQAVLLLPLILAIAAIAGAPTVCLAQGAQPYQMPIFTDAPSPVVSLGTDTSETIRKRHVWVNIEELAHSESESLILELFPDTIVTATSEYAETTTRDGIAWHGRIEGDPHSYVGFSILEGVAVGAVWLSDGRVFDLSYAGDGVHAISEVDTFSLPPDAEPIEVASRWGAATQAFGQPQLLVDDPCDSIEIMVVYTKDAREGEGSTPAMEARVYFNLTLWNFAAYNSDIDARVNIVHIAEVDYTESNDTQTDLDRLKNKTDMHMDNVHTLRDTYGADVVTLIVEKFDNACGQAFTMSTVDATFEDSAFSVSMRKCFGRASMAHEMTHNMGARHDWYTDDAQDEPYSYNHGLVHLDGDNSWRTMMARRQECDDEDVHCLRKLHWSNPDVNFEGNPTGTAEGTNTSCTAGNSSNPDCDAHNALTITNTCSTVANFRATTATPDEVRMKDTWVDTGVEPDPLQAGKDMWRSPYVWVRHNQDVRLAFQHRHQNPEFGQTNYVYVKLQTGENGSAATNSDLILYFADASAGLVWPDDWTTIAILDGTSLPANSTRVFETTWDPPDTGHYCLLARWVSDTDPMTVMEGSNTSDNVRNNNNIVWKNVTIVDDVEGLDQTVAFNVRNTDTSTAASIDLRVEMPATQNFLQIGRLYVNLGSTLYSAWVTGGSVGQNIIVDTGTSNSLEIVGADARIEDMMMAADDSQQVTMNFVWDHAPPNTPVDVSAVQYTNGVRVGGVSYVGPPTIVFGLLDWGATALILALSILGARYLFQVSRGVLS